MTGSFLNIFGPTLRAQLNIAGSPEQARESQPPLKALACCKRRDAVAVLSGYLRPDNDLVDQNIEVDSDLNPLFRYGHAEFLRHSHGDRKSKFALPFERAMLEEKTLQHASAMHPHLRQIDVTDGTAP